MEEKKFSLQVGPQDDGMRLDKFLVERLPKELSRTFIQKLIDSDNILLNGSAAIRHHKVRQNDTIDVTVPEAAKSYIEAQDIPIDVVYEDKDLLVVNKPSGMVTHPALGNYSGTLVNALLHHCDKKLSGVGGVMRPGMVHRLDKDTTGLLVVAKNDTAHAALSKQFKNKTSTRMYVAVVKGVVQLDNGVVNLPVGRSGYDRKKMAVNFDEDEGREAITRYKVVERFAEATLLEVTLGTGRTHQIRVHLSYIGHPILGDVTYGRSGNIARPALHAKTLGFVHPVTKKYVEFTSELPGDMLKLIEELRGQGPRDKAKKK
jgi:23S rRNA pseudouridine1911/1915/1917 synthase